MADIKALMDEALAVDGKIVGTGLPTKIVEAMAELDPDEYLELMPVILEKIGPIMEKAKAEIPDVEVSALLEFVEQMDMGELMGKMQEADPDKVEELMPSVMPKMAEYMPQIMPAMMTLMDKIIASDEEIAEELEGAEDMAINMKMGDAMSMSMVLKDGKFTIGTDPAPDADMSIEIPMDIMIQLMTGQGDPMSAFMGGDVKMDGDMSKGMALMPLMTVFTEKFGMELM
ncbi:MAG: SCP2 sterol-binding domain-containing protein [Halobacteriota archaeon]|nr:SCP2 sterol-binding domain-containing protein [Halobacteriota archaeon]